MNGGCDPLTEDTMLRAYRREDSRLVPTDLDLTPHSPPADVAGALWLDLINPTRESGH
jgi:hypothetical protein